MYSRRFGPWAILLVLLSALALVATEADARVGAGRSMGSRGTHTYTAPPTTRTAPNAASPFQRSTTSPSSPSSGVGRTATAPTTGGFFGRPGFFGGGFLGGLAAGFLGAGLFGLLFGHGLFGGLGGIGSIFGLLLQVIIVVFVARMIWNWWQRRNQPAYAGPGNPEPYDYGQSSNVPATEGGAPAGETIAIGKDDYDAFERLLSDVQIAYGREDIETLRRLATPEMVSYFSDDLADNASRGLVNHVSDVKLMQGDLSEAWREGNVDYATVAMTFTLIDTMVERASGRVVDGDPAKPGEATELWTFRRVSGGQWILSGIQQTE
jgi:predicted lipid-binding transport protein (Tim44 family)